MSYFYKSFEPLKSKTLALLLQLPPSMTMKEGSKKIETFPFERGYRYAVEVWHKSWFDQTVYELFSRLNLCLVWNQLDDIDFRAATKLGETYTKIVDETPFFKDMKYDWNYTLRWGVDNHNNGFEKLCSPFIQRI
jgi:uncharacterized protein YecE (DUF72 family)